MQISANGKIVLPIYTSWLVCLFIGMGCSRTTEEPFSVGAEVAKLPELHQKNIKDGLQKMFATPSRPRITVTNQAEDEDGGQEDGPDSAASTDGKTVVVATSTDLMDTAHLRYGAQVYQMRCAGCHGVAGDGQGPAAEYLQPKPRDYRKGIFKFTSTPYGDRPTRQDLVRTIRRGAKGTSMPAFPWMSNEDLDAVVDYVIYLTLRGRVEEIVVSMSEDYDADEPIDPVEFADALENERDRWNVAESHLVRPVSAEPAYDVESVKLGRTLFIKSSCYQCHGEDAEGQTEWLSAEFIKAQESAEGNRVQINFDAWGHPAPAADITARMLHGGRRPLDIYRRVYTGINGTPMPAFDNVFKDDPDSIWHLVHYVIHIVDGGEPTLGIGVDDVVAGNAADAATDEANSG